MPFKSEAQRGYLFKFHPEIAHRWAKEEKHMARSYFKDQPKRKAKKKTPPSDARSKNPESRWEGSRHPSKAGYFLPYDDDTTRSPYKPGRRSSGARGYRKGGGVD